MYKFPEPRSVAEGRRLIAERERAGAHILAYHQEQGCEKANAVMAGFREAAEHLLFAALNPAYQRPRALRLLNGRPIPASSDPPAAA